MQNTEAKHALFMHTFSCSHLCTIHHFRYHFWCHPVWSPNQRLPLGYILVYLSTKAKIWELYLEQGEKRQSGKRGNLLFLGIVTFTCAKNKKKTSGGASIILFKICTWMLSDVWETTCTIFPLSSEWPKRILARENCFQNLTVDIFSTVPLKENLSKNQQQNLNYLFCYAETIYHD